MSDFGPWLTKAISTVFPQASQGKCYFHLKQNIKKKFSKHFPLLEKYIEALSLCVHEDDFDDLWQIIKKDIKKNNGLKEIEERFIPYFENTYMAPQNKGFYIGKLPPGYGRTNNCLEGHHRYIKDEIFQKRSMDMGNFFN